MRRFEKAASMANVSIFPARSLIPPALSEINLLDLHPFAVLSMLKRPGLHRRESDRVRSAEIFGRSPDQFAKNWQSIAAF
jgi:hypothetical protein